MPELAVARKCTYCGLFYKGRFAIGLLCGHRDLWCVLDKTLYVMVATVCIIILQLLWSVFVNAFGTFQRSHSNFVLKWLLMFFPKWKTHTNSCKSSKINANTLMSLLSRLCWAFRSLSCLYAGETKAESIVLKILWEVRLNKHTASPGLLAFLGSEQRQEDHYRSLLTWVKSAEKRGWL